MSEELISREELSQALNIEVQAFRKQPLRNAARGYMSDVYRLILTIAGSQRTVIMKTESSDSTRRSIADRFGSYRNEQRFYGGLADNLSIRVPHCYLNAKNRFLLVLEDLGDNGIVETLEGVSRKQAAVAIETLARAHAHFYRNPPEVQQTISAGLNAAKPDMQSFVLSALEEHSTDRKAAREMAVRYATNSGDYIELFEQQDQVFTHMDYRVDNLRFLDELVVLDWGESTHAPAGFDLAGFMVSSVKRSDRQKWEEALIELYVKTLKASGIQVHPSTLLNSYRLALLPALYMPGLVMTHGDRKEGKTLLERSLAAIDDHLPYLSSVLD